LQGPEKTTGPSKNVFPEGIIMVEGIAAPQVAFQAEENACKY